MLRAGTLDRRITIERNVYGRDAVNNPTTDNWQPLVVVSASKFDISDVERTRTLQMGAEITTRFRIRWSSDVSGITPKDRLIYEGKTYNIVAVKEIGRREGLELSARARVDQ